MLFRFSASYLLNLGLGFHHQISIRCAWAIEFVSCRSSINQLRATANTERISFIQGDADTFMDIIGLIGEYEGLYKPPSRCSNTL